jgi:hypothetical protein
LQLVDKNYVFDHYLTETTIADVLDDYYSSLEHPENRVAKFHKMRSVIEHRALTVHNDVPRHWDGEHGRPYRTEVLEQLDNAVHEYGTFAASDTYLDVHNYHFTPQGLAFLVDAIHNLGLTNLRVHRLYETLDGRFEFGIVLKKCTSSSRTASPLVSGLDAARAA